MRSAAAAQDAGRPAGAARRADHAERRQRRTRRRRGMSTESLQRLRATAIAQGHLLHLVPAALTGDVVWLERPQLQLHRRTDVSTRAAEPGHGDLNGGTLSHRRAPRPSTGSSTTPISTARTRSRPARSSSIQGGTTTVVGGVLIDGDGPLEAGSSALNIKFDAHAFAAVRTIGAAGIVQNTWRELAQHVTEGAALPALGSGAADRPRACRRRSPSSSGSSSGRSSTSSPGACRAASRSCTRRRAARTAGRRSSPTTTSRCCRGCCCAAAAATAAHPISPRYPLVELVDRAALRGRRAGQGRDGRHRPRPRCS